MRTALDLRQADELNYGRYKRQFNVTAFGRQVEALMKAHCGLVSEGILVPTFYAAKRTDVSRDVGTTYMGDPAACPNLSAFAADLTERLNGAVEKLYRMYGAGRKGLPLAMELRVVIFDKAEEDKSEGLILIHLQFRMPAMDRPAKRAAPN
jgi:hypothetical protein